MYNFDKENDKDFLREAGKFLQERLLQKEIEIFQLKALLEKDNTIKKKLTEELLNLRKRVFDSRQEKIDSCPKDNKKRKKGYEKIINCNNHFNYIFSNCILR
jgi:hypothetical protein